MPKKVLGLFYGAKKYILCIIIAAKFWKSSRKNHSCISGKKIAQSKICLNPRIICGRYIPHFLFYAFRHIQRFNKIGHDRLINDSICAGKSF